MYMYSGRIDRKIEFPLPDEKTRRRIFQIHTKKMTLAEDLDLEEYITAKDDLSGADIKVGTGGFYAVTTRDLDVYMCMCVKCICFVINIHTLEFPNLNKKVCV